MYDYKHISYRVYITGELHIITDDPEDDKFVECAQVAGASLIVSGDHHLLELGEYEGIQIIPAAEFVARFAKTQE